MPATLGDMPGKRWMTNDDDGLLIKPEPRKPGFLVAVGMAVLALLAVGYFAWGKFAGASPPSAAAEMAAHDAAAQAPPVVLAVLSLAAGSGEAGRAVDPAPDSADALIGALGGSHAETDHFNDGLSAHFAAALV